MIVYLVEIECETGFGAQYWAVNSVWLSLEKGEAALIALTELRKSQWPTGVRISSYTAS